MTARLAAIVAIALLAGCAAFDEPVTPQRYRLDPTVTRPLEEQARTAQGPSVLVTRLRGP